MREKSFKNIFYYYKKTQMKSQLDKIILKWSLNYLYNDIFYFNFKENVVINRSISNFRLFKVLFSNSLNINLCELFHTNFCCSDFFLSNALILNWSKLIGYLIKFQVKKKVVTKLLS